MRLQRFVVAIDTDMRDTGFWQQAQHAIQKAKARAQHWGEDWRLAGKFRCGHAFKWRFNLPRFERQISERGSAEQHGDIVQQDAEGGHGAGFFAHMRKPVLDQRMPHHREHACIIRS